MTNLYLLTFLFFTYTVLYVKNYTVFENEKYWQNCFLKLTIHDHAIKRYKIVDLSKMIF